MKETIRIGDLVVDVTRKGVKHIHLSVYPPDGKVTLVSPHATRIDVARAYVASKLGWIRDQQAKLREQAREPPRQFVERESHYIWGRRYLLTVLEADEKPSVSLTHRAIRLSVRPGSSRKKRASVLQAWHRSLLHLELPGLIEKWESKLGVNVSAYFLQRMKTKWGGCNRKARSIRLNTELVRKPKDLLEYVLVHEMLHLVAPDHSGRFQALLDKHYPGWREARAELNALPLSAEQLRG